MDAPAEGTCSRERPIRVSVRPSGETSRLSDVLGEVGIDVVAAGDAPVDAADAGDDAHTEDADVDCLVVVHDPPEADALRTLAERDETDPPVVVVSDDPEVCGDALRAGAADASLDADGGRLLADRIAAVVDRFDRSRERTRYGQFFEALSEAMPDYAFVHDAEGTYLGVLTGARSGDLLYDEDDLVGATVDEVLEPAAAETILAAIEEVLETRAPTTVEYSLHGVRGERGEQERGERPEERARGKQGDRRARRYEGRLVPLSAPYEGRDAVMLVARDITERWAQRRRLQEMESELERTLERVSDGFFSVDEEWAITYVNERFEELTGRTREDVLGENLWDVFPEAITEAFYDRYHEAMETQTTVSFEEYFEPLETWFSVRVHPSPDGLSVYFQDVTDTRERERELKVKSHAMDKASVPLTLVDPSKPDNPLVYVNEAFEEMTGYTAAESVGRNCRFLQGPDTDEATRRRLREAIDAAEPVTVEILNYRADGTPFWNSLDVAPIEDDDGEVIQFIGSQRDVTDRHEREAMLTDLLESTQQLFAAASKQAVAETVVDAVADALQYEAVSVREHDPETGKLVPIATAAGTVDAADRERLPDIRVGDSIIGRAFETGESQLTTEMGDDSEYDYGDLGGGLAVPLGDHGTLNVGVADPAMLGSGKREVVEVLARNATAALDRADRERELREYETLFDTIDDMLFVLDAEGRLRLVSPRLAERVGYDPAALVGEPASRVLTEETSDTLERQIFDHLVTPAAAEGRIDGDLLVDGGETLPVEIDLSLLPYEETFRGAVCSVRDVSERRRREDELRVFQEAVDNAGIGLVMYDETGTFRYVNAYYASMLGYDHETLASLSVWEVEADGDASSFESMWRGFDPGETRDRETVHRRADGTTVPVETVTTAVRIEGEQYHVGTIQPVAGRKERREQAAVLHRILRHNLRNDLSVVIGHAEMLAEGLEGTAATQAGTIADTAREVSDLADTAQSVESTLARDIVRKPMDVVDIVESELAPLEERDDVVVERELPAEQFVYADKTLVRAVSQLLSNAVEHNDNPVATVRVSVSESPSRAGWVDVEVADDGPGVPEHEQAVLTGGEETALEHGSGMGLWVVYWVVTRSGGDLSFADNDPRGSRVIISLPGASPQTGVSR